MPELTENQKKFLNTLKLTDEQKELLIGLATTTDIKKEDVKQGQFVNDFIKKSLKMDLDFEHKFKLSLIILLNSIDNKLK